MSTRNSNQLCVCLGTILKKKKTFLHSVVVVDSCNLKISYEVI